MVIKHDVVIAKEIVVGGLGDTNKLKIKHDGNSGNSLNIVHNLASSAAANITTQRYGLNIANNGTQYTYKASNSGTGPCWVSSSIQDVEILDFDACTDGGTSHTTLAGAIKVKMPNGSTGYINFYT